MYPAGQPDIRVQLLLLPNGLSVRVIEAGPPSGDAVLLVHGWGGCVYTFAELLPALAASGRRAIAFDLPGHGLSDKPDDEAAYTTPALCQTVLEVATALGLRRFSYVGHSMGAGLGLELAVAREPRLERLVLVSPARLGAIPLQKPARFLSPTFTNAFLPRLLTRRVMRAILRFAFGTRRRPTDRDVAEYWAQTQFPAFARACRACVHRGSWGTLSDDTLRSLTLPVLVITGGRDRLVHGAGARADLIPGARLEHVAEGGHLVLQECADETNRAILRFLDAMRPARESSGNGMATQRH